MKIITIVGIRKSGKTSTVTALIEAIRRRGQRVGTCKTVFCPTFSIDQPTSNTARHARSGAQLVCARAKHETAFICPEALALSEILRAYAGFDYVLLEGDYLSPVPRLVAAHAQEDALARMNDLTLAFVGRVSARPEIELPLPRYNALEDVQALLRFIDEHVPDMQPSPALDAPLPPVAVTLPPLMVTVPPSPSIRLRRPVSPPPSCSGFSGGRPSLVKTAQQLLSLRKTFTVSCLAPACLTALVKASAPAAVTSSANLLSRGISP